MSLDDFYCVRVRHYGAAGLPEFQHHDHAVSRDEVARMLARQLETLGPGDKTEITVTRGLQHNPP